MPQLGEIQRGSEIGKRQDCKFIWHACILCGKERWVRIDRTTTDQSRCIVCSRKTFGDRMRGELNWRWSGGKYKSLGYYYIRVYSEDFFWPMAVHLKDRTYGKVLEHRLIMAKHLNRCLLPWEVVHHRNGIRDDNRLENLELLGSQGRHNTQINQYIKKLEKRIKELEKELASKG
jgi:hypothetical protein